MAIRLAARDVRPWIDEAEIGIGDSLIEKIGTGISRATCLVPLLSKAAVKSRWCSEELRMALAMQVTRGVKGVLPVLIEDCNIPAFLQEKRYADLRDVAASERVIDELANEIRRLSIRR